MAPSTFKYGKEYIAKIYMLSEITGADRNMFLKNVGIWRKIKCTKQIFKRILYTQYTYKYVNNAYLK